MKHCPYEHDQPEFKLEWFEDRLEKVQLEFDDLEARYLQLERECNSLRDVNNELREENRKLKSDMIDYIMKKDDEMNALEAQLESIEKYGTKEINEAVELRQKLDEAIRVATLFQARYLELGGVNDKYHNSLIVQGAMKSLADLKGMAFYA